MSDYKNLQASLENQLSVLENQIRQVRQQMNDLRLMGDVSSLDKSVLNREAIEKSVSTHVGVIRHVVNDNRQALTFVFVLDYHANCIRVGFADSGSAGTWSRREGVYLARSRLGTKYQLVLNCANTMRDLTRERSLVEIVASVLGCTADYEAMSQSLRKLKRMIDEQP